MDLEFVKSSNNEDIHDSEVKTMNSFSINVKNGNNNTKKRLKTNHLFEITDNKSTNNDNKILVTEFTPGILDNAEKPKLLVIETLNQISEENRNMPLLLASLPPEMKEIKDEDERFKFDIERRADDMDFKSDVYKTIPIHEYGAALLRGMGWTGPTEEDEKRMELHSKPMSARVSRLGLGATPKPPEDKHKNKKSNEEINQDWKKKAEEKLKKQVFLIGDLIWIRNVQYVGKRAQVVAVKNIPGLNKIRIRFEKDGVISDISKTDAILLTESDLIENPYDKKYYNIPYELPPTNYSNDKHNEEKNKQNINKNESIENKDKNSKHKKSSTKDSSFKSSSNSNHSWLCHSIRKGTVVDVHSDGVASVRLDDGTLIDSIKEKYLETVLPTVGGQCKILRGSNIGQLASLLEKRKEKDEALIQLVEELDIIEISMNDIAAII